MACTATAAPPSRSAPTWWCPPSRSTCKPVPGRQAGRPHRRHLAGLLQQLLLAQRPGAEQRHQRRGPGAVGHQGPPGRAARLPAAGRQVPRSGGQLHQRRRRPKIPQIVDGARKAMAQGYRHIRLQIGVPGMAGYGAGERRRGAPRSRRCTTTRSSSPAPTSGARSRCSKSAASSWATRSSCCTTSTSASRPREAVQFAKDVEPFKLFFLEDPLSPEDIAYFRQIRQQCATPLAMGELFNSPHEWTPLITRAADRLHPHPHLAGRRPDALPQDRASWASCSA